LIAHPGRALQATVALTYLELVEEKEPTTCEEETTDCDEPDTVVRCEEECAPPEESVEVERLPSS